MNKTALALKSIDLVLDLIESKTRHAPEVDTDDLKAQITDNLNLSPQLIGRIKRAEGFVAHAYKCPAGVDTIGYGRNISKKGGISKEEAEYLLSNDLEKIRKALPKKIPCFGQLEPAKQEILIEMAYQLGVGGVLRFKKFLGFLEEGNFEKASIEMLKSRWATQTPHRAQRLAKAMLH